MTTYYKGNERVWSDWLSLYVEHCRRELSERQLAELANALERGVAAGGLCDLSPPVTERVATVAGPLVAFLAGAPTSAVRDVMAREGAARLHATTRPAHARRPA
jgi:hypothetical protein